MEEDPAPRSCAIAGTAMSTITRGPAPTPGGRDGPGPRADVSTTRGLAGLRHLAHLAVEGRIEEARDGDQGGGRGDGLDRVLLAPLDDLGGGVADVLAR